MNQLLDLNFRIELKLILCMMGTGLVTGLMCLKRKIFGIGIGMGVRMKMMMNLLMEEAVAVFHSVLHSISFTHNLQYNIIYIYNNNNIYISISPDRYNIITTTHPNLIIT